MGGWGQGKRLVKGEGRSVVTVEVGKGREGK